MKYAGSPLGVEVWWDVFNVEHGPNPMGGLPYGFDIDDANNLMFAGGPVHNHDASYPFTRQGGGNLWRTRGARGPRYDILPGFTDSVGGPGAVEAYSADGFVPYFSGVANTTAPNDGVVAAFTGSNRAKTKDDKRLAGMFISTDGSPNQGKIVFGTSDGNGNVSGTIQIITAGQLRFLTSPPVYDTEVDAKAAGVPQGTICERPDGTLFRQRLA